MLCGCLSFVDAFGVVWVFVIHLCFVGVPEFLGEPLLMFVAFMIAILLGMKHWDREPTVEYS